MIAISRYYGPKGQGEYTLMVLLPTMIFTFLNIGIPSATIHFVGRQKFFPEDILKTNIILSFSISIIGMFVGVLIILLFKNIFFDELEFFDLYTILIVLPFMFLASVIHCIFQGLENFKFYCWANLSHFTFLMLTTLLLISLQFDDVRFLMIGFILSHCVSLLFSILFLRKTKLKYWLGQFQYDIAADTLKYGFKSHFGTILTFLNYRVDIFFVSYFTTLAQVGFYTNAVNVAEALWLFSYAISAVLFARVSALESDEQKNRLTSQISRVVLWVSICGGILFYFIGEFLILLLFGADFKASCQPFLYLIPGVVVTSHSRVLSNDIAARGRPEINSWFALGVFIVNIILNYALIPRYGINGAAIATSTTYFFEAILKMFFFQRMVGVHFSKLLFIQTEDWEVLKELIAGFKAKWVDLK